MQPQQTPGQYDFILANSQKPKNSPLTNLPKPAVIGGLVVVGLIILVLLFSLVFGHKNSGSTSTTSLATQAQEIVRVSGLVSQGGNDPATDALAATVSAVLSSQQNQLVSYSKLDPKTLATGKNSANDQMVQTAIQNNSLSTAYDSYLKSNLNSYAAALLSEYKSASSTQLKAILNQSYQSVQTILQSPGLK